MKTFEVSLATLKQYMMTGDGPVIALETPSEIRIYLTVGSYELCSVYPKNDARAVAVFKQEYLQNSRIIYPLREVKPLNKYIIEQVSDTEPEQENSIDDTDEETVHLLEQETIENTESLQPEETKDLDVVG
jgi:hypothetical protein